MKTRLLAGLVLALLAGALAWQIYLTAPPPATPIAHERCLDCHASAHDQPNAPHAQMGCAICHLGDGQATEKAAAHRGLEREPGALDTAPQTCARGGCHADEGATVATSLMATARGLIAVDRWAFGQQPLPDGVTTIVALLADATPTAADQHLRRLCAGCHLNTRRNNRDDAITGVVATGSGCSACHISAGSTVDHAPIDVRIADDRCFGCHSRSARIALSYRGLAEDVSPAHCADPVTLPDGRQACRATPDVHQAAGLACIDCHLHTELMGDGVERPHEAAQVEVQCQSCHGPDLRLSSWGQVRDAVTLRLRPVREAQHRSDEPVLLAARGTPLWHVRATPDGAWRLRGKLDGVDHGLRSTPRDLDHLRPGHERLTCQACHAVWTPNCTSCHTQAVTEGQQWNFAEARATPGQWRETSDGVGIAAPTLAVTAANRIAPAAPGMILDLDATAVGGPRVAGRWFSSFDPHTTARQARTCTACHATAQALGLGTGTLAWPTSGPQFTPAHPDATGAATDAWTTLTAVVPGQGTRVGLRSLDAAELRRTLAVGACLRCHDAAQTRIYGDFAAARRRMRDPARGCGGRQESWLLQD